MFYGFWSDGAQNPYELTITNSTFKFEYTVQPNTNLGRLVFELENLSWKNVTGGTEITGKLKVGAQRGTPDPAIDWDTHIGALQLVKIMENVMKAEATAPYTQNDFLPAGSNVTLMLSISGNTITFYGDTFTR